MKKFRLAILLENLETIGKNFDTKSEAEDYALNLLEQKTIKRADILNRETKERERIF